MGSNDKLIIAAAGSGKTTFLVDEALTRKDARILITTYTQANEEEIRRKFIQKNKCIPQNVTVQTWFTFLLQHGVRPFQGQMGLQDFVCSGLLLVNDQSARYAKEKDVRNHYFAKSQKIYSDKLSKFVVICHDRSDGAVVDRLSRIYTDIFIDEVQDLAGYDLEFLKLLLSSKINILLVGDPRQGTYSTNNSAKNKKFAKSKIVNFFSDGAVKIGRDDSSLTINYRSRPGICELSNRLYPDLRKTTSGNNVATGHDGVFFIKSTDVEAYVLKYKPIQLRWDVRTAVAQGYTVLNFGLSKGLEFDRVLIYPTPPFIEWLKNDKYDLAPIARSKFYVGITRARSSVGIVCNQDINVDGIQKYTLRTKIASDA